MFKSSPFCCCCCCCNEQLHAHSHTHDCLYCSLGFHKPCILGLWYLLCSNCIHQKFSCTFNMQHNAKTVSTSTHLHIVLYNLFSVINLKYTCQNTYPSTQWEANNKKQEQTIHKWLTLTPSASMSGWGMKGGGGGDVGSGGGGGSMWWRWLLPAPPPGCWFSAEPLRLLRLLLLLLWKLILLTGVRSAVEYRVYVLETCRTS